MLLECHVIAEDGEDTLVEHGDLKITHNTLVIIVSHTHKCVYVFKGSKVTIVQKFASARKASALRLQKGYRIKHVEELEGIDDDFVPILEFLGGLVEDDGSVAPSPQPKAESVQPKPQSSHTTIMMPSKPKPTETPKPKPTPAPKKVQEGLVAPEEMPPKLGKVYTAMTSLESPEKSSCDYLLVGNKLYMLIGDNKSDLTKGKFDFEEVKVLPEGVFPVENYYPRILVKKKKILGVELWARRN